MVGMSVASGKDEVLAWRAFLRWRRYGSRAPGDFTRGQRALYTLVGGATRLLFRLVTDLCDFSVHGDQPWRRQVQEGTGNVIFLLWHNRLPGFAPYCEFMGRRNHMIKIGSLISASKDGEILARPLREVGSAEIRGSSSSRAAESLREAISALRQGFSIATVGDGPRGPRYELKPGALLLAKATGVPIVPLAWAATRVAQLHRAWDQMMVPLPFSRIEARFDEPLHVPHDASDEQLADMRRDLQARLMRLTQWADSNTRVAWQIPKPRPGEVLKRRKVSALAEHRR